MKAEVRGRGKSWKVWYEDESGLETPLPIYDRDGNLKTVAQVGCPTGKLVEAHFEGPRAEAEEFARQLGADEVKAVSVKKSARKAREPKREFEKDY